MLPLDAKNDTNNMPAVTVVFDGYSSSPKDHDQNTPCTTPKNKLLSNPRNKTQLIELLAGIFRANNINDIITRDDAVLH